MRRRLLEIRRTAAREDGFTVFEMLVASMLLVMGMMATLMAFDSATRNTFRLKQSQVVMDRAQQEMEKIRALPYSQIAMTVNPGGSTDPSDPGYRVAGGQFKLVREPLGSPANMVINGGSLFGGGTVTGAAVVPQSNVTSGDLTMRIYRYVVWQDDASCPNSAPAGQVSCPGTQDFKRVVVAVRLLAADGSFSRRNYVEVTSDFIDPSKTTLTDPPPGPLGVVTAQQFWLSDTPCSASGSTNRDEISANHLLHNTLGTCASGPQTGTTPGAPDALTIASPPDTFLDDPALPGFYDYSNDFYLEPSPPEGDRGLQLKRQDVAGCTYPSASLGANPESKIHRWVSDPLAANFTLTGKVTLEFYTAAINNTTHSGKLCIYLFRRSEAGSPPVATDTLMGPSATTGFFTYTPSGGANWPKATPTVDDPLGWQKVRVQLTLPASITLAAGERLGLALSTERAGTTFDAGIQVLYDHHKTPTRIEVETTTPINAG